MGEHHESYGPLKLYVDDKVVAEAGDPHHDRSLLALRRGALHRLRRRRRRVSASTRPKFEFTGGTIVKVVFDVADDAYIDVEAPPRRRDGARLTDAAATCRDARSVAGGTWRLSGGGGWGAASPKGGARGPRRTARCAARSRASARASGCCSSAGRSAATLSVMSIRSSIRSTASTTERRGVKPSVGAELRVRALVVAVQLRRRRLARA